MIWCQIVTFDIIKIKKKKLKHENVMVHNEPFIQYLFLFIYFIIYQM